jgi:hypothetical protein
MSLANSYLALNFVFSYRSHGKSRFSVKGFGVHIGCEDVNLFVQRNTSFFCRLRMFVLLKICTRKYIIR